MHDRHMRHRRCLLISPGTKTDMKPIFAPIKYKHVGTTTAYFYIHHYDNKHLHFLDDLENRQLPFRTGHGCCVWTLAVTVNGIKGNNTFEQYNSTSCVLSVIRKCKNVTDILKDALIKGVFCRKNQGLASHRMLTNMSRHQLPVSTKGLRWTLISWVYSYSVSACRNERAWK